MSRALEFAEADARKYLKQGMDYLRAVEMAARRWNVNQQLLSNYLRWSKS